MLHLDFSKWSVPDCHSSMLWLEDFHKENVNIEQTDLDLTLMAYFSAMYLTLFLPSAVTASYTCISNLFHNSSFLRPLGLG